MEFRGLSSVEWLSGVFVSLSKLTHGQSREHEDICIEVDHSGNQASSRVYLPRPADELGVAFRLILAALNGINAKTYSMTSSPPLRPAQEKRDKG